MRELVKGFGIEWMKKIKTSMMFVLVIILTISGVIAYQTIFDEPTPQLIVDDIKASFLKEPVFSENNVELFYNYGSAVTDRIEVKKTTVDECTQSKTYDECFRILVVAPYNVAYTAYIGSDTVASMPETIQLQKFIQLSKDVSYKESVDVVVESPVVEEVVLP